MSSTDTSSAVRAVDPLEVYQPVPTENEQQKVVLQAYGSVGRPAVSADRPKKDRDYHQQVAARLAHADEADGRGQQHASAPAWGRH
jgi:hypothetical protein